MGQQQLLLLTLGIIILGITIAVGIAQFGNQSMRENKSRLESGLRYIAADAVQFKNRPAVQNGGGDSYWGYVLPERVTENDDGTYAIRTISPHEITIAAVSKSDHRNGVICVMDDTGNVTFSYVGW